MVPTPSQWPRYVAALHIAASAARAMRVATSSTRCRLPDGVREDLQKVPPFYSWLLRLLLLVSLCILAVILKAIWPDFRASSGSISRA